MTDQSDFQPKVSFRKHFGNDGTVYTQRITLPYSYFNKLRDCIQSEKSLGHPQKNKYSETSGDEFFLFPLKTIQGNGNFCYTELTITQRNFINLFLKLNLKNYNTYIIFK